MPNARRLPRAGVLPAPTRTGPLRHLRSVFTKLGEVEVTLEVFEVDQ